MVRRLLSHNLARRGVRYCRALLIELDLRHRIELPIELGDESWAHVEREAFDLHFLRFAAFGTYVTLSYRLLLARRLAADIGGGTMRSFRWFQPLVALFALMYSTVSDAGVFVGVSVGFAPPLLPVYGQPICPGPDFIWTPGYWAYDPDVDDYYWVPGTWVRAPVVGYLWTPGYWGWSDGYYVWHAGYWSPHVGFYGGINYGFGYIGEGYHGGYWNHGAFVYNTAVTNVNTTIIHSTYNETVVVNRTTVNNVSFNGGQGGVTAQPTAQEKLAASEQHVGLTQQQTEHEHGASQNRELRASFNHGTPTIAATSHAAVFTGPGLTGAKGLTTCPKSTGAFGTPALGLTTPGSQHAKQFQNGPKALVHQPPGRVMGANAHPQTHHAHPQEKKPPKEQH